MASRSTEAAALYKLGQELRSVNLEIPDLKRGQVLVDVAFSGLCHTQVLEARGRRGHDPYLPHLLGHEGSGVVTEIGPDVEKVKLGDRVALSWIRGNGIDVPSTVYRSAEGIVNSGAVSTLVRRTVTCESRLTPIHDSLPLREAAVLGCTVATGAGAVLNTAVVSPGSTVAVFGVGGVGLSAVMAANLADAGMIIAIDVIERKLDWARGAGATHVVNAANCDPKEVVFDITEGTGVDFSIEAAGRPETMETAFECVRDDGGLCVLVGNLAYGDRINLDPFDLIKGKRILGSWGGGTRPDRDIPTYIDLHLAGRFDLKRLIADEYGLSDVNRAIDDLEHGHKPGRTLIDMQGRQGCE